MHRVPHENSIVDWFRLYNMKCSKPSNVQVFTKSWHVSDCISWTNTDQVLASMIWTTPECGRWFDQQVWLVPCMSWYLSFSFIPKINRDLRSSSSRVSKNGQSGIFHFNLFFRFVWFQDCLNKFSHSFTMLSCFPEYYRGCVTWMTNLLLLPPPPLLLHI